MRQSLSSRSARAAVLDGQRVAELGAGDALGDIGVARARFGQPFAVAVELEVVAVRLLVVDLVPTQGVGQPARLR